MMSSNSRRLIFAFRNSLQFQGQNVVIRRQQSLFQQQSGINFQNLQCRNCSTNSSDKGGKDRDKDNLGQDSSAEIGGKNEDSNILKEKDSDKSVLEKAKSEQNTSIQSDLLKAALREESAEEQQPTSDTTTITTLESTEQELNAKIDKEQKDAEKVKSASVEQSELTKTVEQSETGEKLVQDKIQSEIMPEQTLVSIEAIQSEYVTTEKRTETTIAEEFTFTEDQKYETLESKKLELEVTKEVESGVQSETNVINIEESKISAEKLESAAEKTTSIETTSEKEENLLKELKEKDTVDEVQNIALKSETEVSDFEKTTIDVADVQVQKQSVLKEDVEKVALKTETEISDKIEKDPADLQVQKEQEQIVQDGKFVLGSQQSEDSKEWEVGLETKTIGAVDEDGGEVKVEAVDEGENKLQLSLGDEASRQDDSDDALMKSLLEDGRSVQKMEEKEAEAEIVEEEEAKNGAIDTLPKTFEQLALQAGVKLNPNAGVSLMQEERMEILDRVAFRTQISWQELVQLPHSVLEFPEKAVIFIQRNEVAGLRALFGDVFSHEEDQDNVQNLSIEQSSDWENDPKWQPSDEDVERALTFQMINELVAQNGRRLSVNPESITYRKIVRVLQMVDEHKVKQSFQGQSSQKQAELLNQAVEEYSIPPTVLRRMTFNDDGKLDTSNKNIGTHLDGRIDKLFLPHSMEQFQRKGNRGQRDRPTDGQDTDYFKNQATYGKGTVTAAVSPLYEPYAKKTIEAHIRDENPYHVKNLPSQSPHKQKDVKGDLQQTYSEWQLQLEQHQDEVMSREYIENVMFPENTVELMDRPLYDLKTDIALDKYGPRASLPRSLFQFRSLMVNSKHKERIVRLMLRMNYFVPSIYRWETRMVIQCGPFPYHPENLRARLMVFVKDLQRYYGLSDKGLQFIIKLAGHRYSEKFGEIVLSCEQYYNREDNRQQCLEWLEDMVEQAHSRYPNKQLHQINGQYYAETPDQMRERFMQNNFVKIIP